jgi:iron complex outermembrane receptor protein
LSGRVTSSLYGDYMNTERVGGFTTFNLSAGYKFDSWELLKNPYVKLNVSNITDRKAFSYVSSAQFLAVASGSLYSSSPTYGLLQPRAFMVTVGASFF